MFAAEGAYQATEGPRVAQHPTVEAEHAVDVGVVCEQGRVRIVAQHVQARVRERLAERSERGRDQQQVSHANVDAHEQRATAACQVDRRRVDGLRGRSSSEQAEDLTLEPPFKTYAQLHQVRVPIRPGGADVKGARR